ncbi:MAG: retropepsin-like aspartic protease family protein [Cellvibrionaceae bacterium]
MNQRLLVIKFIPFFFLVCFLFFTMPSWSADSITVKGLFKGAALLIIDGETVLLKEGKSKHDVKLIQASSKDALLEINGKRQRVGLSKQVGGSYQQSRTKVTRIASQQGGHHWVRGSVNGRSVDFLVDTGASLISFNLSTAKRLGIDYQKGESIYMNTANGVAEAKLVTLAKVTVGEITHYNVKASVAMNDALSVALLGNSFLSRTNMRTENGVLVLESK